MLRPLASLLLLIAAAAAQAQELTELRRGIPHDALYDLCLVEQQGLAVGAAGVVLESHDGGQSWQRNDAFANHETRESWNPGAAGLTLHTIVSHPDDPDGRPSTVPHLVRELCGLLRRLLRRRRVYGPQAADFRRPGAVHAHAGARVDRPRFCLSTRRARGGRWRPEHREAPRPANVRCRSATAEFVVVSRIRAGKAVEQAVRESRIVRPSETWRVSSPRWLG